MAGRSERRRRERRGALHSVRRGNRAPGGQEAAERSVRALPPLDATVVREKLTSRRRCLGFVTLPDKWAMEDVIRELHKSKVDGRMISVRHGMPKDWQHQQPMRDRVGDSGQGWARTGGCVVRREHPRREPYAVGGQLGTCTGCAEATLGTWRRAKACRQLPDPPRYPARRADIAGGTPGCRTGSPGGRTATACTMPGGPTKSLSNGWQSWLGRRTVVEEDRVCGWLVGAATGRMVLRMMPTGPTRRMGEVVRARVQK
ncbi:unnamed protein product [Ostreobium quekettii]|uniref:RRM domain-containing protein n=1 Tax=Ostreobium quekettii TaxID=121088 RepID=A0A8S1J7G1_9CHLO|nr:unnamed protein product [Ostreobium quekettii]